MMVCSLVEGVVAYYAIGSLSFLVVLALVAVLWWWQ